MDCRFSKVGFQNLKSLQAHLSKWELWELREAIIQKIFFYEKFHKTVNPPPRSLGVLWKPIFYFDTCQ